MKNLNSCFFKGWVKHQRLRFGPYQFHYRIFMFMLDLDETKDVFKGKWLWSVNRRNWAEFRESDYLKEIYTNETTNDQENETPFKPRSSLKDRVASILNQSGTDYELGKVLLLTGLRYFGFRMNPVSFFYCYEKGTNQLKNIVCEVNNTPWDQQHLYILNSHRNGADIFEVKKQTKDFHVSPFMPMNMHYRMLFSAPSLINQDEQSTEPTGDSTNPTVKVSIQNYQDGKLCFKAIMKLRKVPISGFSMAMNLLQFPAMSLKVFLAIYWQALRLYFRGAKYFPNQKKVKPIFTQNEG